MIWPTKAWADIFIYILSYIILESKGIFPTVFFYFSHYLCASLYPVRLMPISVRTIPIPALLSIPSDSCPYQLEQYLSNNIMESPCLVSALYSQPIFIWIRTTRVQQWYSVQLQDASNNATASDSNMYTYFLIAFFFRCNTRTYFPSLM
jgi:hypothetical protein